MIFSPFAKFWYFVLKKFRIVSKSDVYFVVVTMLKSFFLNFNYKISYKSACNENSPTRSRVCALLLLFLHGTQEKLKTIYSFSPHLNLKWQISRIQVLTCLDYHVQLHNNSSPQKVSITTMLLFICSALLPFNQTSIRLLVN